MNKFVTYYSLLFALTLLVGESLVMINTQKYWPLGLDDFVAVAALLGAVFINARNSAPGYYLACWTFITGNIYAVLFMRLDPISGSGERIGLVSLVLVFALIGCVLSFFNYRTHYLKK